MTTVMADQVTTTKPCDCWGNRSARLKEMGFEFSPELQAFEIVKMNGLELKHTLQLPLVRTDGKKLRSTDPRSVQMAHCPFCGAKL